MALNKKIFKRTGYFLQEIVRSKIVVQAILVGLISGALVVLFKISITELFLFIQNYISELSFVEKLMVFPLITTLGGLISGILVFKIAPETKGSGIPYVKMTLARMGNMTRIRSILVKFFAGVAGIGTGLSLGREGPSVQLGAGAGALVGKIFRMKGVDLEKLIAAGAGSAIGATFNAPIAGTVFVLEELVNKKYRQGARNAQRKAGSREKQHQGGEGQETAALLQKANDRLLAGTVKFRLWHQGLLLKVCRFV